MGALVSGAAGSLAPGHVVQDTYRIDRLLGEGGMGATYAGHNIASDHPVAIKVISGAFAGNSRATDLFRREANLLRTIQHDAVVRYETTLLDKEGRLYLVMELLPGHALSHYLAKGARLGQEDTLRLGRRLAGGLDAIASVNVVHRDLAPDNIFVANDDIAQAKLIDFGLASNTVGTEKSILGDSFAGKFSFCAPEQFGQFDGRISPRTDAYALGLVLMKVSGLEVPGAGMGMAAGAARREDIEIDESKVGAPLAGVLRALLKADPAERPSPLVPVFETALDALSGAPERSEDTRVAVETIERGGKKSKLPLLIGGGVLVALALAGGTYFAMQPRGGAGGASIDQADIAREALKSDDPFKRVGEMIAKGGENNLNAAFATLRGMGSDAERPVEERIEAYTRAAAMVDPEFYKKSASPFAEPVPSMARRLYQAAAELGSEPAARAAQRLEN